MSETESVIKRKQEYLLDIFKEFKRVCEKNGLRYFAIGGTCIGAIRHKGFIPWDDDLDIAMPAEDYQRLISNGAAELQEPYSLFLPKEKKHYTMIFGKMQNHNTTSIEKMRERYVDTYIGINIDIFPVYGLPNDEKQIQRLVKKNESFRKMNYKRRLPLDECDSLGGKLLWFLLLPLRFFSFHCITDMQENMLKKYPFENSSKIYFPWRLMPDGSHGEDYTYKDIFYLDDFRETIQVPFEDTFISVPKGYDRYLTMDFGDYMTPPTNNVQRAGHDVGILDFEKPYTYYAERKGKDHGHRIYNGGI